jgi:hypothetical protein
MIEADVTFSVPVAGPALEGAKITPTVQLALAAKVAVHVSCTNANPAVSETNNWLAARGLVLVTVTVCAVLIAPTTVDGKASWAGLMLSPEVTCPAPFSGTCTLLAPCVAETTVRVAELPPAKLGVKITSTLQLAPALSEAPQVVDPVAKLAAPEPVISKATLAAATPPLLVIVSGDGALATPTF